MKNKKLKYKWYEETMVTFLVAFAMIGMIVVSVAIVIIIKKILEVIIWHG